MHAKIYMWVQSIIAHLPQDYHSDFSELTQAVDPVVQGSVKATLQPVHRDVCVQDLGDWTQPSSVIFPKSYILAAFDQECVSELVIV